MAKINKRGDMWYSDYYKGIHRIRRALSINEEESRKMLRDLLTLRKSEKTGMMPKDFAWFLFREKYLTFRKANVKPKTYFNDERAFDIVAKYGRPLAVVDDMSPEYLDDLSVKAMTHEEEPLSKRTISGHIRRLKTAMHQAEDWDLIPLKKWKKVKCVKDRKRKGYLEYPVFQKVVEHCEGAYQRAAMVMGWAGLRRGEVLHLDWSDVDFKRHQINVQAKEGWAPKGSEEDDPKERVVDMTQKLETYLRGLPECTGLVIGERINEDVFTDYFSCLGDRLGLHLFPHKFRHTCGSFLISTGSNLKVIGELLGQDDIRSTEIYTHMMPKARRIAVDQMQSGLEQMKLNP